MENLSIKKQKVLESIKNKDLITAKKICKEILKKTPEDITIQTLLGTIYYNLNNYKNAIKYLEKSYTVKQSTNTAKLLGNAYNYLNKYGDAYKYLKQSLGNNPDIETLNKIVDILFKEEKETYTAIKYSLKIYEECPFDIENIIRLGHLYLNSGDFNNGIKFCNKALKINQKNGKAWILKGIIDEAIYFDNNSAQKCFKKALKLGETEDGYYNLALNYRYSNRKKSSYYAKLLLKTANKDQKDSLNNIVGSNYFAQRNLKMGFKFYKHSWDSLDIPNEKLWNGRPHKNSSCYLHFTKGFGDQIMFIRYLPILATYFKTIKIYCKKEVFELFNYSYKHLKNVEFYDNNNFEHDYITSLFYLPYRTKTDFINIPYNTNYLYCDKDKIQEYKNKYFKTNKPKIGLCWEAGEATLRFLLNRTIPLSMFTELLQLKNIQLYSVQKNSKDINSEIFKNSDIIDLGSKFETFYDTAGALMNLDLLITVDTSVANLAGALGVKTWLLLPKYADWRWFDEDKKSDWYSSIEIFKQTNPASWEIQIKQIVQNLRTMID